MKKYRTIVSLLLASSMVLAMMTACGSSQAAPAEEPAETEEDEEAVETEEDVIEGDFDLAAGLTETETEDSRTIETDYFTLTLPLPETWTYEINEDGSISFYNIAAKENNCGGHLMTLVALDPADTDHEGIPHYSDVGEAGGKLIIAEYPSDVQADIENEDHMKEYETVYGEIMKIEEGAADAPLTLK